MSDGARGRGIRAEGARGRARARNRINLVPAEAGQQVSCNYYYFFTNTSSDSSEFELCNVTFKKTVVSSNLSAPDRESQ